MSIPNNLFVVFEDWSKEYLPDVFVGVFDEEEKAWCVGEEIMEGMRPHIKVNIFKMELNKVYQEGEMGMKFLGSVNRINYELGQYEIVRVKNG